MSWKARLLRTCLWGLPLPLIVLNGWVLLLLFNYFRSIITIVVVATLLAFVLAYPVTWLQRFRLRRPRAVLLVLLLFGLVLLIVGITLIPLVIEQVNELGDRLPSWIASGTQQLDTLQAWAVARRLPVDLSHWITQLEDQIASQLQSASGAVVVTLVSAISSVLNVMLTLVLTFYLLLYGRQLWDGIFRYLPISTGTRLRESLRQNFHNYFVSQAIVALLMGLAMTLAFVVIRVPFGLVFGLVIGILAMFPFGAAVGITLVSGLTALSNIWLGIKVLTVAVVIDQLIENGTAPQLIGGFTGLSPVWILISLLVGAKVAGLLGVVVAVPVAGSIRDILAISVPQSVSPDADLLGMKSPLNE
ncbi:AI-2E family transporter [Nodosilinea sp. LEGE 07088]|uniref:AI-2E family transporter n=1 Tax=Nodosilinea sp. LEGE 07088 TaxID=2777968 RepID=UPI001881E87D|nr:AI-2E family transporter [Nodosilinea sp. LEGE 07088]MBE9139527.1 AI-2E family transporter [Nodosilinea sp. LEGE 07088]